ncbi:hybrid sensor histidine kinase/response regulator [Mariprofundus micogutta]|nr:PAS domain S-box protein [Mariprofundus micogutta]
MIILIVVATVSLGFMVFELFDHSRAKQTALQNLNELSQIKADRLAESLILPLWEVDKDWVSKIIDSEMQDKQVYAITVSSERKMFAGKKRDENWQLVQALPDIAGDYIVHSNNIIQDKEIIGSVTVYLSQKFMQQTLFERLIREAIALVFITLFVTLILILLLNRVVVQRLQKILYVTRAIANGDYSHDLHVSQHDEVDLLASGINAMKKNIQQREDRIRLLLDSTAEAVYGLDMDGRCTFVNKQCLTILGYESEDECLGENMHDLIHHTRNDGSPYPANECHIYEAFERGEGTHVVGEVMWNKSGGSFPSEYRSFPVWQQGEIIGAVVTFTDISERQKAEEKIQLFSQALEQSGEAIVITNHMGVIEHINPTFTLITGYSEKEVLGQNPRILKSGSQSSQFYENMWDTLIYGQTWQGKVINKKKSGEFYPAMLTVSPIKNEAGKTTHYIGIQQNLEKFEELEAQFHQSQKMEAIGTLVGGIAHDFNNNLAGITGNLYLAKKAAKALPEVVKRLNSVEQLSFSAAATIQQLLAFSRKGIVEMHPLSISSFLKETIKLNQVSLPENINFQLQVNDTDMQVNGDINQLQQVLMNLINNAHDAVKEKDSPSIQVHLNRLNVDHNFADRHEGVLSGEYACISVVDNGTGIKPEYIEHIFEPFFTTKEPGKGTGLGMAMVYGAVKTHGGFIDVQSSQGEKPETIVQIFLPLMNSDQAVFDSSVNQQVMAGNGETILLVNDNETVLETGTDVLEGLGYAVLTATNGLLAVEMYQSHRADIDLIILDVVMPELGGVEALKRIRTINPEVKAIFATGYDRLSTLSTDQQEMTEKVISKPFAISKLSQSIRELLD